MFILHITRETGNDRRYGIRKSLLPVIEALQLRGHKVEVFDQSMADCLRNNWFETWLKKIYLNRLKKRLGNNEVFAWQVLSERITICLKAAKYAARQKVTHVHCHDPLLGYAYQFFAGIYGATKHWGYSAHAFGRFVKLRLGIECDESSLAILRHWENKATKNAKFVVIPTQSGLNQMMKDMEIERQPDNFHIIPHAVVISSYDRNQARQVIGVKDSEKLILAVGQLIPMKRFTLLLKSIALMHKVDQLRIIILGEGPEKEVLINLAKEFEINRNFEIRTTDDIGEYLSATDVYVSVSSTESFGMANCEALLAGVPCICSNVDAVPELLKDGAILTGSDPKEIAMAINTLLTNVTFREDLLIKAQAVATGWASPEQIGDLFEKIYLNCQ